MRRNTCKLVVSCAILGFLHGLCTAQQLPEGFGFFIRNIRGYGATFKDLKMSGADYHLDMMRRHLNGNIGPNKPYKDAKPVPTASGLIVAIPDSSGYNVTVPTHGMDEITSFVKLSGASWVAVKCAEGTRTLGIATGGQWDDNLLTCCKQRNLRVYGYHTVLPGTGNPSECEAYGKAQAKAVINLFKEPGRQPDGLVIMPSGEFRGPKIIRPEFYASSIAAEAEHTAAGYLRELQTLVGSKPGQLNLTVLYCCPAGLPATPTASAHRKFMDYVGQEPKTRAVMPRCFWIAVTRQIDNRTPEQVLYDRVDFMVNSFLWTYLLQPVYDGLVVIPVGQSQYLDLKLGSSFDISGTGRFVSQIGAMSPTLKSTVPAIGLWSFDNHTPKNHDELAKLASTTKFPIRFRGALKAPELPSFMKQSDWVPGFVEKTTLDDWQTTTCLYTGAFRGDDPNDCLPMDDPIRPCAPEDK